MAATFTYGPGAKLAANAAVDVYGWLRFPEQTVLDCATTVRSETLYRRIVRQARVENTVVIEVDSPLHDGPTAQADDDRKDARYRALGLEHYRLR